MSLFAAMLVANVGQEVGQLFGPDGNISGIYWMNRHEIEQTLMVPQG